MLTNFSVIQHPPEIALEFFGVADKHFRLGGRVFQAVFDSGTRAPLNVALRAIDIQYDFSLQGSTPAFAPGLGIDR